MTQITYINPKALQVEFPELYSEAVSAAEAFLNSLTSEASEQIVANAKAGK